MKRRIGRTREDTGRPIGMRKQRAGIASTIAAGGTLARQNRGTQPTVNILAMQRTVGNRAVQRMMRVKEEAGRFGISDQVTNQTVQRVGKGPSVRTLKNLWRIAPEELKARAQNEPFNPTDFNLTHKLEWGQ